jgi:hypothetical protein
MRKNIRIPNWLDRIIYDDFQAIYEPRPFDVVYNPDQEFEFVKLYLGTYFPRSFAEAYCIIGNMLENNVYKKVLEKLEEVNLLDFCCGTGGEIVGAICALNDFLPNVKRINVDAFDANPEAVKFLYHLLDAIVKGNNWNVDVNLNPQCLYIESEQEIKDIVNLTNIKYQFILSFKALNEFVQHNTFGDTNVYKLISSYLTPLLSNDGIYILSDVTTKLYDSSLYYPQLLNAGINTLVKECPTLATVYPYVCNKNEDMCKGCYMQDVFEVSHRYKNRDVSKVAYRIICNSEFAQRIQPRNLKIECRATNPNAEKSLPYKH